MSLYKDASLVMIPSAYKDGRLYSIRPVEELGDELVTNGSFETNSDWSLGSGSTISGGSLNIVSAPYNANTKQTISLTNGTTYKISINYTASGTATSNTFQLGFGDSSGNPTDTTQHEFEEGSGVKTLNVTAASGDATIIFRSRDAGTCDLSINSVSVKEVITANGDFDFSRGSNLAATRVDVNGLIEKGRENLVLQGSDISTQSGSWFVNQGGVTIQNATTSPIGTNTASQITANGSNTYSGVRDAGIAMGALRYTYSVYLKAQSGTPDIRLTCYDGVTFHQQDFSITTDWERYSITFTPTAGTHNIYITSTQAVSWYAWGAQFELGLVATDYIETGASTAQAGILEDMPRLDYSGGASCPALLLEPQRTNLVINSEYANSTNWSNGGTTYSNNQATSPEGVDNAIKLIEDNSTSFHYLGSDISGVTTAGTYSISGFIKKGTRRYGGLRAVTNGYVNRYFVLVDLDDGSVVDTHTQGSGVTWSYDVQDYGSGWYRIEISGAHTSGTIGGTFSPSDTDSPTYFGGLPDYDGSTGEHIFCYGLQAELGSYPTSYIPTYGSSVTRSSETSVNTSTSVLESLEGDHTIVYDFNIDSGREGSALFLLISRSNGYYGLKGTSSSNIQVQAFTQGDFSGTQSMNGLASGNHKIAIRWSNNEGSVFLDGVKQPNTLTDTPTTTSYVQVKYDGGGYKNKANQQSIFPTALTDSECIALTTL